MTEISREEEITQQVTVARLRWEGNQVGLTDTFSLDEDGGSSGRGSFVAPHP